MAKDAEKAMAQGEFMPVRLARRADADSVLFDQR